MTYIQTTQGGAAHSGEAVAMHVGKKRERQEDCADICNRYVIVADGMGGQAKGDEASRAAVTSVSEYLDPYRLSDQLTDSDAQSLIEGAFEAAQTAVCSMGDGYSAWSAPATTLLVGLRTEDGITIGHLGDSRVYVFVAGKLVQITHDHENPDGSINAYVGAGNYRMPDIIPISGEDARVIFATDGLFGMLSDERITEICAQFDDKPTVYLASALTDAAVQAGGFDNVTVAVVDL